MLSHSNTERSRNEIAGLKARVETMGQVICFATYAGRMELQGFVPDHVTSDFDKIVRITIFPNEYAKTLKTKDLTLPEIADLIAETTAAEKSRLPYLKMAAFGSKKSDGNSLRNNDNVLTIGGVEGDYDDGEVSIGNAIEKIKAAHLSALIYATAGYEEAFPKWRVLCPTSRELPPEQRTGLVARINGVLGGILDPASFTLSQSFHFGSVEGKARVKATIIEGDFIDLRDDLDAGAIGRSITGADGNAPRLNNMEPAEPEVVRAALSVISSDGYHPWLYVGGALYREFGEAGFEMFDQWSAKSKKYDATECKKKWEKCKKITEHTVGTIFHYANEASPGWRTKIKEPPVILTATPYVWIAPETIPPRDWLYDRRILRKFVTSTIATGGIGKTSVEIVETLAMVTGKNLLGIAPFPPLRPLRVWYWNLEDPHEETQRRIQAAAKYYDLTAEDLGDRLFVDCGRQRPLVIAKTLPTGVKIMHPLVDAMVGQIIERRIDVLIIDPFVSCHEVDENNNNAIDTVTKEWGRLSDRGNCGVELSHHSRKGEHEVTTESARGAKAFSDACRAVRVANRMTADEGDKAGVDNHRLYFRTFSDKANLVPPAERSTWFKLESVNLGNNPPVGGLNNLDEGGDNVGVVTAWHWPAPLEGVTEDDFDQVATVIRAGSWRQNPQAEKWVGKAVAEALDLDLTNPRDKARVIGMVKSWIAAGKLEVVDDQDESRKTKKFVKVPRG